MNRVVITGMGFVTSIGNSRAEVVESLLTLRHGFSRCPFPGGSELPLKVVGALRGFEVTTPNAGAWTWPEGYDFERSFVRSLAPHGLYAACAMEQALAESRLAPADLRDGRTGLFCASGGSPMLMRHHLGRMAENGWLRGHPLAIITSIAGTLNFTLAAHYGIRGAACGFSSACASGAHAVGYAFDEIALGRQERMLVVGAEDLNLESALPFHALNALSLNPDPGTASRPFDLERDGFVPTGGAVAMVLETEVAAAARGVRPQATLRGWGQACDGYHMAQPEPEGAGLRSAIEHALASASIEVAAVDYVSAHATSTPAGDSAEARALQAAFTRQGAAPAVSSTKALTGHGLSLSGIMESAFCALALNEGFIPGQAHLRTLDPACEGLNIPRESFRPAQLKVAVNNSSGFGGANVVHVLSTYE